jgi:TolB-like protein/tetratricopeptide (TPR) repeat protein
MAEREDRTASQGGPAGAMSPSSSGPAAFLSELRRRRVLRVLVGYGITAFALLQVVEPVMHGLHLPEWVLSVVVVALGLGFPVAVALAWAFDLGPTGIERTLPAPGTGASTRAGTAPPTLGWLAVGLGLLAALPGLGWYFLWRGGAGAVRLGILLAAAGVATVALWLLLRRRGGEEVRTAPAAPAAPPVAPAAPSIAVLPFADLSPAQDQGYFCDGIAEELLNALSGVPGLRVASRSSSFPFKGRAVDAREIGRTLGVATLLEGSVRKAGDRLRIGAQLVSGADGYQLWAETFDRGLEDVFAIQEEIAQAVVRALKLRLSGQLEGRLTRAGTRNLQAYEMYLRGRQFLMSLSENGYRFARQMFKGAIELDPAFAQAHAGLADTCFFILQWHLDEAHADAFRAESLAASGEALRLDPDLAEAHVSRGNVLSVLRRGEEAERDFRRALVLNPSLADAHYYFGRHLFAAGRFDEALREYEETVRLNPDDYATLSLLVSVHHSRGDRAMAVAAAERALGAVERRLRLNPDDVRALYMGGGADIVAGNRARGLEKLARAIELAPNDFATLYNVACGYANAGEPDLALDMLDRAVSTGRGFRQWMENDGDLASLRTHPRFQEILARVAA